MISKKKLIKYENKVTPNKNKNIISSRSHVVTGCKSPKPIVVRVVNAKYVEIIETVTGLK